MTTTKSKTLVKGNGEKAVEGSTISVDFVFVNGRTGAELETSYGTAAQSIALDKKKTQPVIVKNLLGARVGSRVVIAIAPKEKFRAERSGKRRGRQEDRHAAVRRRHPQRAHGAEARDR